MVPTNVSALADGQSFTITDGSGQSVTFEINDTSPPGPSTAPLALCGNGRHPIGDGVECHGCDSDRQRDCCPNCRSASQLGTGRCQRFYGIHPGKRRRRCSVWQELGRQSSASIVQCELCTCTDHGDSDRHGHARCLVDWNGDGDFNDAGEQFVVNQPVQAGANTFTLQTPVSAAIGFTTARFRLSALAVCCLVDWRSAARSKIT